MATEIYFIADPDMPQDHLVTALEGALAAGPVSALLLRRDGRSAAHYRALVDAVRPLTEAAGTALLVEGDAADVRRMGADGLHLAADIAAVRAAVRALKPDFIVGTGPVASRHEAMDLGEAGVDYVLFGPMSGAISAETRELAHWWAEAMEISSVLCDPGATRGDYDAAGCEFIGLPLPAGESAR
jgi:thiamine-phosphate pyrophosphorylase